MKPITNHPDPLHGAVSEIISAMSALNMEPNPLPIAEQTGRYLSETDGWAKHAMEHLQEACNQLTKAQQENAKLRAALAPFAAFDLSGTIYRDTESGVVMVKWKDGKESDICITVADFDRARECAKPTSPI